MKVEGKVSKRGKRGKRGKRNSITEGGITAQDFNWGTIFNGSRAQLVAAGLMPENYKLPKPGRAGAEYSLPLDWQRQAARREVVVSGIYPHRWDAQVTCDIAGNKKDEWEVWARFDLVDDLDIRKRAEMALATLRTALRMVEEITPVPLSKRIPDAIKAGK